MTDTMRASGYTLAPSLRHQRLALLATGIAAVALLGGCANTPHPDRMAQQSRDASNKGDTAHAITLAEAAVMADARNPAQRLLLANAYLRAGRFESARQAYADAIGLGDDSSRAALGLVLSDLALGHNTAAVDTINTYGDILPSADLGLALVMAGQNERGIGVLATAIRQGQNQPKMRQNLAFAYALSGMWAEAKIMAGQDVPADQVEARVRAWASMARPEDGRRRVASLLGAPMVGDSGQPEALALAPARASTPVQPTPVKAVAAAPATELPPVSAPAPAPSAALARVDLARAPAAPAAAYVAAAPQPAPALPAVRPAPVRVAAAPVHGLGSHLVQLGAFNSDESAQRAWHHYAARNPRLQGHPDLITKVNVHGRDFWRLQVAGFAGQASAASLCGTWRAHGGACMVMAVNAAAHVNAIQTAAATPAPGRPDQVNAARR